MELTHLPLPGVLIATANCRKCHGTRNSRHLNLFAWFLLRYFTHFLRESERNRVVGSVFLVDLVGGDDAVVEQVLKETLDEIACALFLLRAGVFKPTFLEHVGKGDGRRHFFGVQDDFKDTANDVMFEFDNRRRVILMGNMEKSGVEGKELPVFHRGDAQERRFGGEFDDKGFLSVDFPFDDLGGKDVVGNGDGFAFVVAELYANVMQVDFEINIRKLFEACHNGSELIFAGIGVVVADFAGQPAIENGRRKFPFIGTPKGNANVGNVQIKLIERFGENRISGEKCRVDGDFDGRGDFTETLMIFHLDDSKAVGIIDVAGVTCLGELEKHLNIAVVRHDHFFHRINLDIGIRKFFHARVPPD